MIVSFYYVRRIERGVRTRLRVISVTLRVSVVRFWQRYFSTESERTTEKAQRKTACPTRAFMFIALVLLLPITLIAIFDSAAARSGSAESYAPQEMQFPEGL